MRRISGWLGQTRPERPASSTRLRSFRDVVVHPTQDLLRPPFVLFRGGPDWPAFWLRRRSRHCRFGAAIPLDLRPWRSNDAVATFEAAGVWCGPVVQHFGHAIATFGSRIPHAVRLPGEPGLVFSARPDEEPPGFFWEMLRHYGADLARVKLVRRPTRFGQLCVGDEAEPYGGTGPHPSYLDLLDRLSPRAPSRHGERIYVSRAGMWKGKVAGEAAVERAFAALGYDVMRPETLPLAEQLASYRQARHIVFADGSAIHALQLLGRSTARVTVIARDRWRRTGRAALAARGIAAAYVDATDGLLAGVGRAGRPQPSAGLAILDQETLLNRFDDLGVPLRTVWDGDAFLSQQAADITVWIGARLAHPLHRIEPEAVRRSARRLRIAIDHPALVLAE